MITTRLRLFRLAGIPINLDVSWFIVLALLTWTLSNIFGEALPELTTGVHVFMGLVTALAFFGCIVLHEMGHALVAKRAGIPIRGITLFLFGGVAELEDEPRSAGREFLMAIAGPLVSAVLAALFAMLGSIGRAAPWPASVVAVLDSLTWINLAVLIFNLVPAFPLDGGRVLRSVLWSVTNNLRRATYWASLAGRGFAWLLIVLAMMHLFAGNWFQGIWLGLIGMFLNQAAQAGYHQVLVRHYLGGEPVSRFMNNDPIVVSPDLDLRHWVDDYVYRYHRKMFPVSCNGLLEGVISTQSLDDFARDDWALHTVAEVMNRDVTELSISPDADAMQALARMQRLGTSRLLVTQNGSLVGVLSLKDLLSFFQLKMELEDDSQSVAAVVAETEEAVANASSRESREPSRRQPIGATRGEDGKHPL